MPLSRHANCLLVVQQGNSASIHSKSDRSRLAIVEIVRRLGSGECKERSESRVTKAGIGQKAGTRKSIQSHAPGLTIGRIALNLAPRRIFDDKPAIDNAQNVSRSPSAEKVDRHACIDCKHSNVVS